MSILKKLKPKCASILVVVSLVFAPFVHADYTRSCPASLKLTLRNAIGGQLMNFKLTGHSINPRVTVSGSPSGSSSRRTIRKGAKNLSSYAAAECMNQWTAKAIKTLNSGKTSGKVIPPSICKNPDKKITISTDNRAGTQLILAKKKFATTKSSVDSIRWAYNTKDDTGFYDVMQKVCRSYGSGMLLEISPEIISGGKECLTDQGKFGWYRLICDGRKPTELRFYFGEEF